jgi:hypothetical protein
MYHAEPLANTGPTVGDTALAELSQSGDNDLQFFSKSQVVYSLGRVLGQDVSHLFMPELTRLINAIPQTQASPMGTPEREAPVGITFLSPITSNDFAGHRASSHHGGCPKLEVWYNGLKGGLALEAVQY